MEQEEEEEQEEEDDGEDKDEQEGEEQEEQDDDDDEEEDQEEDGAEQQLQHSERARTAMTAIELRNVRLAMQEGQASVQMIFASRSAVMTMPSS